MDRIFADCVVLGMVAGPQPAYGAGCGGPPYHFTGPWLRQYAGKDLARGLVLKHCILNDLFAAGVLSLHDYIAIYKKFSIVRLRFSRQRLFF